MPEDRNGRRLAQCKYRLEQAADALALAWRSSQRRRSALAKIAITLLALKSQRALVGAAASPIEQRHSQTGHILPKS